VSSSSLGVGVDVEPIRTFTTTTETFVSRNFTVQEQTYCKQAADPSASYAGRWAAKEAIVKALTAVANSKQIPIELRSSGAGLNDIEIIPSQVPITNTTLYTSGAPSVTLTGHALVIANKLGINPSAIRITISHSGEYAVAVAAIN
jgi:phosphopantetheine--protein transferase-like protein